MLTECRSPGVDRAAVTYVRASASDDDEQPLDSVAEVAFVAVPVAPSFRRRRRGGRSLWSLRRASGGRSLRLKSHLYGDRPHEQSAGSYFCPGPCCTRRSREPRRRRNGSTDNWHKAALPFGYSRARLPRV